MAIVIAMLSRGKPGWVVVTSFLFGISLSVATALQLAGINISTDLIKMLPFLVDHARAGHLRPARLPAAGLAVPYVRGTR